MLSALLQKLIDEHRVSVREICELTGRGESTVYRWVSGESQPTYRDIELLVRRVSDPIAREQLVCLMLMGLPVVVEWLEGAERDALQGEGDEKNTMFAMSLTAMRHLTTLLDRERHMLHSSSIREGEVWEMGRLIDEIIRNLTATKSVLVSQHPPRRKARPLPSAELPETDSTEDPTTC